MKPLDIFLAFIVVFIWGTYFAAAKIALEIFPPFFLSGARMLLGVVALYPFIHKNLVEYRLDKSDAKALLVLGFLLFAEVALTYYGLSGTEASAATLVFLFSVPFGVLYGAMALKENVGTRRWSGVFLAFSGVATVIGSVPGGAGIYLALVALAALAWNTANILSRKLTRITPLLTTFFAGIVAGLSLLILSFIVETGQLDRLEAAKPHNWAAVFYTGVGSFAVANGLWYVLLRRNPLSAVTPFILLEPVIAVIFGYILLGEPVTTAKIIGCSLVVAGMILIEKPDKKRRLTATV